jgi:hypothetical protein
MPFPKSEWGMAERIEYQEAYDPLLFGSHENLSHHMITQARTSGPRYSVS